MKTLNFSTILATSLLLIGCGGGGGGGGAATDPNAIPPASAAAPFTVAGFGGVAGPSAAAVLAATSGNTALEGVLSAGSASGLPSNPASLAKWAVARFGSTRESAQASQAVSDACPAGGSLSGEFNDADGNDDVSAGDSFSLNFTNCILSAGEPAANGGFSFVINSIAYGANDAISAASFTMQFRSFNSYGNTVNGATTITINGGSVTISYTNFSSTRGSAQPVILNYTAAFGGNGTVLNINGLITINNNTYTLSTPTAITFGSVYPNSGVLRVTDAAGGRIDIISSNVSGPFVDCDLYLPGDNVRDGRISSTWSAI